MAYTVPFTDEVNKGIITVEDNDVNNITSLSLPGKGVTSYGKIIAENMLQLLENFAFSSPPVDPVEGQTWYDTTTNVDQLKIYDGTQWVPANGIFKATASTDIVGEVPGDLWVDTDNQQLYLNTGSGWILVGPEFSQGSATGFRASLLTGIDNQDYAVLIVEVDQAPVMIVSGSQFRPKTTIDGFFEIRPGINLSTVTQQTGSFKLWGIAEASESLRIQNKNISADRFLRSDVDSTALGIIRFKNNQGIRIGDDGQLSLQTSGPRSLIRNNFSGAGIDFQVKQNDQSPTVLRLDSNVENPTLGPRVGINNLNPEETLDVIGTVKISDVVTISSTIPTNGSNSGALVVKGGAWFAKGLRTGTSSTDPGDVYVGGKLDVVGDLTSSGASATSISGFETITATTFIGNVQGNLTGNFTGNASSATKLLNSTTFEITGDVESTNTVTFDGAGVLAKTFSTSLSNAFISSKDPTATTQGDDEILINRTSGPSPGLFRIPQSTLVSSVPTNPPGVIMPYGGDNAPPGWLLCDGSPALQADYPDLFTAIGHKFLDTAELAALGLSSSLYFGLPDLRGRLPLGRDSMGGTAANRVTSLAADTVGNSAGSETTDVKKENLPAHEHDLRSSGQTSKQYYAVRDSALDPATDSPEVVSLNMDTVGAASSTVSGIPSSGSISAGGQTGNNDYRTVDGEELGAPIDVMSPYTTVNYIIWTGNAQ